MTDLTANLDKRIDNLKKTFQMKVQKKSEQNQIIKEIEKKMVKTHNVSLRILVDLTNYLKIYQDYFEKMNNEIDGLDVKFSDKDNEGLKGLIDPNIKELNDTFNKQINNLKRYYQKMGSTSDSKEMARLRELENLNNMILTDVKYLTKITNATNKK